MPILASVLNVTWATPFTLHFFDNRTLTIRNHMYPIDDLLCFVNGWYSFPDRSEVVRNYTYLEEFSDGWCNHLSTVPGYDKLSLEDVNAEFVKVDEFLRSLVNNGKGEGYVPKSVVDGLHLVAAGQCLTRGRQGGALCNIADCAAQFCFATPQSTELLYTVRGECQNVTQ